MIPCSIANPCTSCHAGAEERLQGLCKHAQSLTTQIEEHSRMYHEACAARGVEHQLWETNHPFHEFCCHRSIGIEAKVWTGFVDWSRAPGSTSSRNKMLKVTNMFRVQWKLEGHADQLSSLSWPPANASPLANSFLPCLSRPPSPFTIRSRAPGSTGLKKMQWHTHVESEKPHCIASAEHCPAQHSASVAAYMG